MNKLVTKNYGNADNNDINIDKQLENTIFVHNCDKILEMKEM